MMRQFFDQSREGGDGFSILRHCTAHEIEAAGFLGDIYFSLYDLADFNRSGKLGLQINRDRISGPAVL